MESTIDKFKKYPEIGKDYRHYKGGRYNVLTLAKHSEVDEIKSIIKKLKKEKITPEGKELLAKLEKITCDDLVVYKSTQFGSVHARPLFMWYERVSRNNEIDYIIRFQRINP